jgi:hypothetical protein
MGLGSAISQAIDAGDIDLLISVPLLLWLAQ